MDLSNKTIIITGAARVGKNVAQSLSEKGANLIITYLTKQPDLKLSGKTVFVQADLSKQDQVLNVVAIAKKEFGAIHGLVHMAATYNRNPWKKLSEQAWDKDMNDIARSSFLLAKAVGDEMLAAQTEASMIFISDWSVTTQPYKDYLPYNSAKGAVQALAKSLAIELAPRIKVNVIAPGPILKPDGLTEEENAEVIKNTPLAKWGGAEEIAKAVVYLLESDFVTGQILYVDGGRSAA